MKAQRKPSVKLSLAVGLLLALALAVQPLGALALPFVDVERQGSLTVRLERAQSDDFDDIYAASFESTLYRLADIAPSGGYTAAPALAQELQPTLDTLTGGEGSLEANVAAVEELKTQALALLGLNDDADPDVDPGAAPVPDVAQYAVTIKNGASEMPADLPTGLYLLYTPDVATYSHVYSFEAAILSMPGLFYGDEADAPGEGETGAAPAWDYEYTAYLKPQQAARTGRLRITKTLTGMDTATGSAMFIFHVVATMPDGAVVYDNMLALNFDAATQKTLELDNIPVGASVQVTEVYTGAGYTLESDNDITVTILPEPDPEGEPIEPPTPESPYARYDEENTAEVAFVNTPTGRIPGRGVVNHYEPSENNPQAMTGPQQLPDNSGQGTQQGNP